VSGLSDRSRLVAASLIDWTGTGFYVAVSAIFLTRSVGLTPNQAGLAPAAVGLVTFAGSVPVGAWGPHRPAAAWQITYTLAPPRPSAEFFATYGLGSVATGILGPVLVTSVVFALGSAGRLALAASSCARARSRRRLPGGRRRDRSRRGRLGRRPPFDACPLADIVRVCPLAAG
jgi:hypothetical protein